MRLVLYTQPSFLQFCSVRRRRRIRRSSPASQRRGHESGTADGAPEVAPEQEPGRPSKSEQGKKLHYRLSRIWDSTNFRWLDLQTLSEELSFFFFIGSTLRKIIV